MLLSASVGQEAATNKTGDTALVFCGLARSNSYTLTGSPRQLLRSSESKSTQIHIDALTG
jgi:hypothetical protein